MLERELINLIYLSDLQQHTAYREKLAVLRDRAAYLSLTSGMEPMGICRFANNQKSVRHFGPLKYLGYGAAFGAGTMGALGLLIGSAISAAPLTIPLAFSGAIAGCALGALHEYEDCRLSDLFRKYEAYLDAFELAAQRAHVPPPQMVVRHKEAVF